MSGRRRIRVGVRALRPRRTRYHLGMAKGAVLVLALTACGRIGFAPGGDRGDGGDPGGDGAAAHCLAWGPFSAPVNLGLHGASAHWLGGLSGDELTVYFADWTSTTANDVWMATRPTLAAPFAADVKISELDTVSSEWAPRSSDGLQLMFSTDRGGNYDLMIASRATTSSAFGAPVPLPVVDGSTDEDAGDLSEDGLRLYFSSSRATAGAIYLAERPDLAQPFGTPVLLAELDSPAEDSNPTLTGDELEVFFQTRRSSSTFDVWWARRARRDVPFDPPVAVTELDTTNDDVQPFISADGRRLYFNYDTLTGGGKPSDLWMADRACTTP